MAGRPKKEENENQMNTTAVKDDMDLINVLRQENEELKLQMKLILEKLEVQETKKTEVNESNNYVNTYTKNDFYTDISPLKLIKVISLSDGGVSLRTKPGGDGKVFRFDKFGHSIPITYSDLQDVIATDRSFIEDGCVYICDEDVVRNNYLEDIYSKFITVDTINNIFSFPTEQIVDMVKNTTETIQESIISIIVRKINNNEYVDMNKVDAIGKVCKTPCNILELAQNKRSNQ